MAVERHGADHRRDGAYDAWLAPQPGDANHLRGLLVSATVGMRVDLVSTAVNNVRNQGSDLIKPLPDA